MAELTETEGDPFGAVTYSPGVTLDLNASEEELAAQVVMLLKREGRMADTGLTCDLKDSGQDCLTCPEATLDPAERRSALCRLGKDQSALEGRFNELASKRRLPLRELAVVADAASEVGHLPDDLSELLTEVGL